MLESLTGDKCFGDYYELSRICEVCTRRERCKVLHDELDAMRERYWKLGYRPKGEGYIRQWTRNFYTDLRARYFRKFQETYRREPTRDELKYFIKIQLNLTDKQAQMCMEVY